MAKDQDRRVDYAIERYRWYDDDKRWRYRTPMALLGRGPDQPLLIPRNFFVIHLYGTKEFKHAPKPVAAIDEALRRAEKRQVLRRITPAEMAQFPILRQGTVIYHALREDLALRAGEDWSSEKASERGFW